MVAPDYDDEDFEEDGSISQLDDLRILSEMSSSDSEAERKEQLGFTRNILGRVKGWAVEIKSKGEETFRIIA